MILNLDPDFKTPDGELLAFEKFVFHGGEPHVRIEETADRAEVLRIRHRLSSFQAFGELLLAIDAAKRMGYEKIELFIPYFPAARQDRVMVPGEPLSVKVYADILNLQAVDRICVYDPHSEVAPALLERVQVYDNYNFVRRVCDDIAEDLFLVAPDGGALKKIHKLAANLQDYPVIECSKKRDLKTGKLSGFRVNAAHLEGRPYLIVDDICDGGGTFMGLAKELKDKGAGELYLAVSHGIFSKGFAHLEETFHTIYTTDSFTNHSSSRLKQYCLAELINK